MMGFSLPAQLSLIIYCFLSHAGYSLIMPDKVQVHYSNSVNNHVKKKKKNKKRLSPQYRKIKKIKIELNSHSHFT